MSMNERAPCAVNDATEKLMAIFGWQTMKEAAHFEHDWIAAPCSLIPGFAVKLSVIILAGPTVLSAVGACPPHDGVRRRWWINVASAVSD
jgi:hypothetical protein